MSVKAVILFLLVICAMAIVAGPGFRRFLRIVFGIGPRPKARRKPLPRRKPRGR